MGKHSRSQHRPVRAAAGVAGMAAVGLLAVPGAAAAGTKPAPPAPVSHGCYDIAICADVDDVNVFDLLDVAN